MSVRARRAVLWVIVGVVVLAGIVWLAMRGSTGVPWYSMSPSPSGTGSPSAYKTSTPKSGVATNTQTYTQAVAQYVGRRIQFDAHCQAQPTSLALQAGLSVMIDNRSGDARTFAVGGVYFTLPGYGWKIVTPAAPKLPANVYLDCGSARNVGIIVLQ